ncbi:hypothetical protein PSACC_02194 [Paramicrosporidium saccamoebae]|uniref:Uncharacterized protein n=1 Tax=Paramicrosporidium saccamoebae TaxID=1246581 RepID=A0A2H9TJP3_9FUNG|nr:hypothetical protein PSACC_02194 [Paramicrosporidium saccamoebae]
MVYANVNATYIIIHLLRIVGIHGFPLLTSSLVEALCSTLHLPTYLSRFVLSFIVAGTGYTALHSGVFMDVHVGWIWVIIALGALLMRAQSLAWGGNAHAGDDCHHSVGPTVEPVLRGPNRKICQICRGIP